MTEAPRGPVVCEWCFGKCRKGRVCPDCWGRFCGDCIGYHDCGDLLERATRAYYAAGGRERREGEAE
jgi:hypothetical protein